MVGGLGMQSSRGARILISTSSLSSSAQAHCAAGKPASTTATTPTTADRACYMVSSSLTATTASLRRSCDAETTTILQCPQTLRGACDASKQLTKHSACHHASLASCLGVRRRSGSEVALAHERNAKASTQWPVVELHRRPRSRRHDLRACGCG